MTYHHFKGRKIYVVNNLGTECTKSSYGAFFKSFAPEMQDVNETISYINQTLI